MTLTVVVGSSGSGKTTFLNNVHKSLQCTYIRQYHNIRPYIIVSKIPNFDPTGLPYWDTYDREGTADTIRVGGTMAGEFVPGLSGGQRKLLLLEIIHQRFQDEEDILLLLDEPFAGVTDDFLPFIEKRLNQLRERHNVVLVTNDYVEILKTIADNVITVSAIDRSTVQINNRATVEYKRAILALAVGDPYVYETSWEDIKFFADVEVLSSGAILTITISGIIFFGLLLVSYWNSPEQNSPLIYVAANIVVFFPLQAYLNALVDWRNYMSEEAEAHLHSSAGKNRFMKTVLTVLMMIGLSGIEFGVVNCVVGGMDSAYIWLGMLMDSASLTLPFICLALYTNFSFETVAFLNSIPNVSMMLFSTTFSPGAGVDGLKGLRYLYVRFYVWCMLPPVEDSMEGCPSNTARNIGFMVLSGMIGVLLFVVYIAFAYIRENQRANKTFLALEKAFQDAEFLELQVELFGDVAREMHESRHSRNSSRGSRDSRRSRGSRHAKCASKQVPIGGDSNKNENEQGAQHPPIPTEIVSQPQ